MNAAAGVPVERFVELIREVTGNVVPRERHAFLVEVAARRARTAGFAGAADYLEALARGELDAEWESLIPLITIKESYFFRAPQQFEAIRTDVLPRLLRSRAASRHLRIWSAACARGEEPSTLAMQLAHEPALAGWDWSILATDLDEDAIAGARRGHYGERAVAQVPPALLARHFTRQGKLFAFDPELRSRIQYQTLNLAHPPYALPFHEYDLILLRNVLIYFSRPLQQAVVASVGEVLSRKGFLFLGASETLWQLQDALAAIDLGACFCYHHPRIFRPPVAAPQPPAKPAAPAASPRPPAPPAARPSRALAAPPPRPEPPAAEALPPPPSPPSLGPCAVHERLAAAARLLADNRIDDARRTIDEALAADPSEPSAHALEGFVNDLAGRTDEAIASYRAALYLDPALFQARLLLADSLLRLGRREMAEHQYREVLSSLSGGRERNLAALEDLPIPGRERALKRCRQALKRG